MVGFLEFSELIDSFSVSRHSKHVTCEMVLVVVLPARGFEESLHVTPRTLDCINLIPGFGMGERDGVINGAIRVNLGSDNPRRRPTIADERGAGLDPVTDNARVLAVLSRRGRRNFPPDSLSIPPKTH